MANHVTKKYNIDSESLRRIMKRNRVTIKKLAECTGIVDRQMNRFLKGNEMPEYAIDAIALSLHISPSTFVVIDNDSIIKAMSLVYSDSFTNDESLQMLSVDKYTIIKLLEMVSLTRR